MKVNEIYFIFWLNRHQKSFTFSYLETCALGQIGRIRFIYFFSGYRAHRRHVARIAKSICLFSIFFSFGFEFWNLNVK